jgi:hypothetical protein
LDIVFKGYEYEVTFDGTNPMPAAIVVDQINAALPEKVAEVLDGKVAFKGEDYWEVLSTGSANSYLGLSTTNNTKCYLTGVNATPRQYPTRTEMKLFISKVNILASHFAAHLPSIVYHAVADVTNGLATASLATTASVTEVCSFLNDFKTKYNAHDNNNGAVYHIGGGGGHTITTSDVSTWSEAVDLYNDIIEVYVLHCVDTFGNYHQNEHAACFKEQDEWEPGEAERRILSISDPVYLTGLDLSDKYVLVEDELYRIDGVVSFNQIRLKSAVPENKTYSWSIKPTIHLQGMDASLIRFCNYDQIRMSFTPDDEDEDSTSIYVDSDGGVLEYITYDPTAWAYYSGTAIIEHLLKNQYIPVYKETTSIPYLQEEIVEASPLYEGKDFNIVTYNGIKWIDFENPVTSPEFWWAEYLLFENDAIEDNFGYLVGVKAEDIDDNYLSVVRALFYSYWNGAKINSLRLGVHALLGLPFTEAAGTILDIDEFYSTRLGRVLIEDSDVDSDRVRIYYYDRDASIATNPDTDATYAVGDSISTFVPLCSGVEVTDYIEDEDWFLDYTEQGVMEEIEKYHTFYVNTDIDIFGYNNVLLAQLFLDRAKAVRTDYIFSPYKTNIAEVDVTDIVELDVAIHLYDNVCPLSDGGVRKADDWDGSGVVRAKADEYGTSGDFVGADAILSSAKRDDPWTLLEGGASWADMISAVQEAFNDLRAHMSSGVFHTVADSVNLPSLTYYPSTSSTLVEVREAIEYLLGKYNDHDRNNGGTYHSTGGTHLFEYTTVYDVYSVYTRFNQLKSVYNTHIIDGAIHGAVDGVNTISADDLIYEDGWLPHAGPPYIIGKDWSNLPSPIVSLMGKTLKLNVTDGRMCSELMVAIAFNDPAKEFPYVRDGGVATPMLDTTTLDTTNQWAGDGSLLVANGTFIGYDSVNTVDGAHEKGTVCFRFRGDALYLQDPAIGPVCWIFTMLGPVGGANDVHLYSTVTGTALDTINFDIYDSTGVLISSISGPFLPNPTQWYELCIQWDVVNGYQELMIDGVSIGTNNAVGLRTLGTQGMFFGLGPGMVGGVASFSADNLRVYDDVIHNAGYTPPSTEEYYDRGEQTITFGLGTAQQAMDDINDVFPNVAHLWHSSVTMFHPFLFSWNRKIEITGGTALNVFGFEEGQTQEYRSRYHIIGADISAGANIASRTLDFTILGTTYTATFVGPNPVSGAAIITAINLAAPFTFARWSGNYLKLGSPFQFTIEPTGNANLGLGFEVNIPMVSPVDYEDICIEDWAEIEICEDYGAAMTKNDVIDVLNTLGSSYENHIANIPNAYHVAIDAVNTLAVASLTYAATMADCAAYINDIKAKLNAHDNNSGGAYHGVPSTHQIATADATDWTSIAILYAAVVTVYHAHIGDA